MPPQGPGSTRQNNGPFAVGGFYNLASFTLVDGQSCALQFDINGNLKVTSTGGGGSNASVGLIGTTAPTSATEIGVVDAAGNLQHVTGLDLTNAFALTVAIVDTNGNQISSFGGGSQFAMGSAQAANSLGTIALGYDGTNVRGLSTSTTGQLHVIIDSATLGTVIVAGNLTNNIAVPAATNIGVLSALANAAAPTFAEGNQVLLSTDLAGNLRVTNIQGTSPWIVAGAKTPSDTFANPTDAVDSFALLAGWDATNSVWRRVQVDTGTGILKVDIGSTGTVAVSNPDVQFADNAASGATPTGTLSMGWDSVNSKIRALKVDASQNLLVDLATSIPSGTNVIGHVIVDSGAISVTEGTTPWIVTGAGTAGVPGVAVLVTDPQTVSLNDLMQTLILEVRAMRSAIVYMITENQDVLTSDFDPSNQDFQPVN
jgi:hypothetical protein